MNTGISYLGMPVFGARMSGTDIQWIDSEMYAHKHYIYIENPKT
jgi:hypothetical protein